MMNISNETAISPTNETCDITHVSRYYNNLSSNIILYIISVVFGLSTHSYILWLIFKGTGKGIASEFFNLNISVCEIMLCLRSLTTLLAKVFPPFWYVRMFLTGFSATARFFQCLVCVERYLAVVHPVTFLKYKHLRYKVVFSTVTWIMIIACCVFILTHANPCNMHFFKCLYLVHFIIFLAINLFCCLAVLRALKKPGPGQRGREGEKDNYIKKRAFYVILITTVTLVFTYVPGSVTGFQYILSVPTSPELDALSLMSFFLPGFVQPLLFFYRVGKLPFCRSP